MNTRRFALLAFLFGGVALGKASVASAEDVDVDGYGDFMVAAPFVNIVLLLPSDTAAPETTIAQAPASLTNSTSATITFSASEANCTFERNLDNAGWVAAFSPETLTGLSDGSHTYQVRAKDAAGNVDASPASTAWTVDATPPGAPSVINSNPNPSTNGILSVYWSEGGYDGNGSGVSKYDVRRVTDGTIVIVAQNQGAAYLIVSGLANGSHVFQVRCTDAAGNVGPWSTNTNAAVVSIYTPDTQAPSAPGSLIATAISSSQINLSWSASTDNTGVVSYKIWRNSAPIATVTGTAHNDVGLSASTTYSYQVKAYDAAGNESAPAVATATTPAPQPLLSLGAVNLTPNPTGGTHTIQWTVQGAVKQAIARNHDGGPFQDVFSDLSGGTTSVTVGNSIPEGNYVYRVTATDSEGNQKNQYSAPLIVDKTPPLPPTSVNWSFNANGSVVLSWGAAQDAGPYPSGLKHYLLRRKSVGGDWVTISSKIGLGKNAAGKYTDAPAAGTYFYAVASRDKVGLVGEFGADIGPVTIGNPPPGLSLVVSSMPAATAGVAYGSTLAASGGTPPYAYSVSGGTLPPGLALSAGTISGVPTQVGSFSFTIKVSDSAGQSASQPCAIVVAGAASTLKIKTSSVLPIATAGLTYAHIFEAEGGVAPLTWEIASGVLPGSWTLSPSTGLLSGTGVMGTMLLSIKVTDGSVPPKSVQKDFTLLIESTPSELSIVSPYPVEDGAIELPAAMAGNGYSTTLVAAGATAWSVSSGKLSSGMELDSTTGQLLGTPSASSLFVVRATDGVGAAAYRAVRLEVAQAQSVTLVPVSMTPHAGKVGEAYTFTLTAQGGTVPFVWSIHEGALPPGLSLNGATGEISGTPLEAGSWSATIQVADASAAAQSTTFDIALSVAAEPQVQGATETAGGGGGGGCGCVGLEALLLLGILGLRRRRK